MLLGSSCFTAGAIRTAGFSSSPEPSQTRQAYLGRTCRRTRTWAGMISSFSQTSCPMRFNCAPQPQLFSLSAISWIHSTRGRSAGSGLRPCLARVCERTGTRSGGGCFSMAAIVSASLNSHSCLRSSSLSRSALRPNSRRLPSSVELRIPRTHHM